MHNGRSVLVVIPARGGSKGVPRKNVRLVAGRPLISWTISAAKEAVTPDRIILSSDDTEIMAIAAAEGCEVPFQRPAELASDMASGVDPLLHAIREVPGYDYVVLLQPTSPMRTSGDIDAAVKLCIDRRATSVVSVVAADKHPAWMYSLETDRLCPLLPDAAGAARRQDLPAAFSLNGAIYVIRVDDLLASGKLIHPDTLAYRMDKLSSVDIDTEDDLLVADFLLKRRAAGGR